MPVAQRSGSQEGGEQQIPRSPPKSSQAEVSAMFFFMLGFIQSIPKPTFFDCACAMWVCGYIPKLYRPVMASHLHL